MLLKGKTEAIFFSFKNNCIFGSTFVKKKKNPCNFCFQFFEWLRGAFLPGVAAWKPFRAARSLARLLGSKFPTTSQAASGRPVTFSRPGSLLITSRNLGQFCARWLTWGGGVGCIAEPGIYSRVNGHKIGCKEGRRREDACRIVMLQIKETGFVWVPVLFRKGGGVRV